MIAGGAERSGFGALAGQPTAPTTARAAAPSLTRRARNSIARARSRSAAVTRTRSPFSIVRVTRSVIGGRLANPDGSLRNHGWRGVVRSRMTARSYRRRAWLAGFDMRELTVSGWPFRGDRVCRGWMVGSHVGQDSPSRRAPHFGCALQCDKNGVAASLNHDEKCVQSNSYGSGSAAITLDSPHFRRICSLVRGTGCTNGAPRAAWPLRTGLGLQKSRTATVARKSARVLHSNRQTRLRVWGDPPQRARASHPRIERHPLAAGSRGRPTPLLAHGSHRALGS